MRAQTAGSSSRNPRPRVPQIAAVKNLPLAPCSAALFLTLSTRWAAAGAKVCAGSMDRRVLAQHPRRRSQHAGA
eukprot:425263-Rhodomonas_salina.1